MTNPCRLLLRSASISLIITCAFLFVAGLITTSLEASAESPAGFQAAPPAGTADDMSAVITLLRLDGFTATALHRVIVEIHDPSIKTEADLRASLGPAQERLVDRIAWRGSYSEYLKKVFTADEIKALAAFARSPAGTKMMSLKFVFDQFLDKYAAEQSNKIKAALRAPKKK